MSNDADRQGKYISRHRRTETGNGIRGLRRRSRRHSDSEFSETVTHSSEYGSNTHSTGVTTTSRSIDEEYQSHLNKFLCCCVSLQFSVILILLTLVSLLISESWFGATLPFSKKQTEYDANWREESNPETQTPSPTYDKANTTIPSCSGNACDQNSNDGIIFSDDFDFLDFDKWKHVLSLSGGRNWEFQAYTNNRTNSFIKDGKLHIKPTFTNDLNPHLSDWVMTNGANLNIWGSTVADVCTGNALYGCERNTIRGTVNYIINPIQSAQLRTAEYFSFRYGTVEIRAKLPKGDWLRPAIRLLPYDDHYGQWPSSGEIDIMESRCNADLSCNPHGLDGSQIGVNQFVTTLHYGPNVQEDGFEKAHTHHNLPNGELLSDKFHVWKLEWKATGFKAYFDDVAYWELKIPTNGFWGLGQFDNNYNHPWNNEALNAPFDREFYLIINLAVGGNGGFFPDTCTSSGTPKPWNDTSAQVTYDFWTSKSQWMSTWGVNYNNHTKSYDYGEQSDFIIDYVRVTQE